MPQPTPAPTPQQLDDLDERLIAAILELDEAAVSDLLSRGASVTRRRRRTGTPLTSSFTPLLLTGVLEGGIDDEPDAEFRRVSRAVVRLCREAGAAAVRTLGRDEALRRLRAIRVAMMNHLDGPLLG